jgi:hypothetical protein
MSRSRANYSAYFYYYNTRALKFAHCAYLFYPAMPVAMCHTNHHTRSNSHCSSYLTGRSSHSLPQLNLNVMHSLTVANLARLDELGHAGPENIGGDGASL